MDLQALKNDKEFYESDGHAYVCVYGEEVIGLCNAHKSHLTHGEDFTAIEVSFIVKKGHQGQGIGTALLLSIEEDAKKETSFMYISAKHHKGNIASHKAFLKAGYVKWDIEDNNRDLKIKKIVR